MFHFAVKMSFGAGVPSPYGEPLLPDAAAENHPFVVQKCQVRAVNV